MVSNFLVEITQYKHKIFERFDKTFNIIDDFLARKYTDTIKAALRNYETSSVIILYEEDIQELKGLIEKEFPDIPVIGYEIETFIENYSSKTNNFISLSYEDELYVPGEQMALYLNLSGR